MTTQEVLDDCRQEMDRTTAAMRKELAHVRTGRATTALLDAITVDYYGAKTPLQQIASVHVPEARLLVVQPFDKSVIGDVERAILKADIGLTPQSDGKVIRVPVPELTEERRRDIVKQLKKQAEEFRVSVRNHRRDAIEMLKEMIKGKDISEDDGRHGQERVDALTKGAVEKVDEILKGKEQEVMAV